MQDLATQQKQLRPNKRAVLWIHQKSYLSSTDILMLFDFSFSFEVLPASLCILNLSLTWCTQRSALFTKKKCTPYLPDTRCDSSSNQHRTEFLNSHGTAWLQPTVCIVCSPCGVEANHSCR